MNVNSCRVLMAAILPTELSERCFIQVRAGPIH